MALHYFNTVESHLTGKPVSGATVTIRTAEGALETIYSDDGITIIPSSAVTTDEYGFFEFWTNAISFTMTVSYGDYSRTIADVDTGLGLSDEIEASANSAIAAAALSEAYATALYNESQGIFYDSAADGVDPVTGVADGDAYTVVSDGRVYGYHNVGGVATFEYEILTPSALKSSSLNPLIRQAGQKIERIAHRGFANLFPENTMPAFSGALRYGADALECDVQVSSDGVPVVIHDTTVDRTTDGTGNVSSLTLSALKALDAGTFFSAVFENTRIPTFAEFLDFGNANSAFMYPEIKGYRTAADIDLMVEAVQDRRLQQKVMFQSFTASDLERVRELDRDVFIGFLGSDLTNLSLAASLGRSALLLDYTAVLANPGWVQTIRQAGVEIGVWTVDRTDYAIRLLEIGVSRIMSNNTLEMGVR